MTLIFVLLKLNWMSIEYHLEINFVNCFKTFKLITYSFIEVLHMKTITVKYIHANASSPHSLALKLYLTQVYVYLTRVNNYRGFWKNLILLLSPMLWQLGFFMRALIGIPFLE